MTDDEIRKIKAEALFEFSLKFGEWRNGQINVTSREIKQYIKAVRAGKDYEPPSTEGAYS